MGGWVFHSRPFAHPDGRLVEELVEMDEADMSTELYRNRHSNPLMRARSYRDRHSSPLMKAGSFSRTTITRQLLQAEDQRTLKTSLLCSATAETVESSCCRLQKLEATERRLGAVRTLQRRGRVVVASRQFRDVQRAVRALQRWVRSVLLLRRLYEVVVRALQADRYRRKREAEERKEAARKAMEAQRKAEEAQQEAVQAAAKQRADSATESLPTGTPNRKGRNVQIAAVEEKERLTSISSPSGGKPSHGARAVSFGGEHVIPGTWGAKEAELRSRVNNRTSLGDSGEASSAATGRSGTRDAADSGSSLTSRLGRAISWVGASHEAGLTPRGAADAAGALPSKEKYVHFEVELKRDGVNGSLGLEMDDEDEEAEPIITHITEGG